jgi:hypothetical protein
VDDLLIEVRARPRLRRSRAHEYAEPEEPIYLAVHRLEDSVYYKRIEPEAYRLLEAFGGQKSIGQAIEAAFESSSLPEEERIDLIRHWFANWTELGWFCRLA